jgi:hypothetical protein
VLVQVTVNDAVNPFPDAATAGVTVTELDAAPACWGIRARPNAAIAATTRLRNMERRMVELTLPPIDAGVDMIARRAGFSIVRGRDKLAL